MYIISFRTTCILAVDTFSVFTYQIIFKLRKFFCKTSFGLNSKKETEANSLHEDRHVELLTARTYTGVLSKVDM